MALKQIGRILLYTQLILLKGLKKILLKNRNIQKKKDDKIDYTELEILLNIIDCKFSIRIFNIQKEILIDIKREKEYIELISVKEHYMIIKEVKDFEIKKCCNCGREYKYEHKCNFFRSNYYKEHKKNQKILRAKRKEAEPNYNNILFYDVFFR